MSKVKVGRDGAPGCQSEESESGSSCPLHHATGAAVQERGGELRDLLCPACGACERPVVRIAGFPTEAARRLLDAGDAEVVGCIVRDATQVVMPLRCRACRRVLADARDSADALAELAVGGDPVALVAGAWGARNGGAVCVVLPVAPTGTSTLTLEAPHRALLRCARRAIVVMRVEGHAARFVAGRGARAASGVESGLQLVDPLGLDVRIGDGIWQATLRVR